MSDYVLSLEDSKTQAHIVGGLFEKCGYVADYAHDIAGVQKKLKLRGYSLIVLDVFVGPDNTLDHLPRLRKQASNTPIAVMTAGRRDQPRPQPGPARQGRFPAAQALHPRRHSPGH